MLQLVHNASSQGPGSACSTGFWLEREQAGAGEPARLLGREADQSNREKPMSCSRQAEAGTARAGDQYWPSSNPQTLYSPARGCCQPCAFHTRRGLTQTRRRHWPGSADSRASHSNSAPRPPQPPPPSSPPRQQRRQQRAPRRRQRRHRHLQASRRGRHRGQQSEQVGQAVLDGSLLCKAACTQFAAVPSLLRSLAAAAAPPPPACGAACRALRPDAA